MFVPPAVCAFLSVPSAWTPGSAAGMPATPALPPLPVRRARSGAGARTRVVAPLPVPVSVSTSAPAPSILLAAAGFRSEKCRF